VKMTAEEAKSFDGYSQGNALALIVAARQRGCDCQPYQDWFTFKRWLAQGMQVQKGERGVKLGIFVKTEKVEKDAAGKETVTVGSRPWMTTVFCRHQVKVREAR
jgi:antirestriction protein ArdC